MRSTSQRQAAELLAFLQHSLNFQMDRRLACNTLSLHVPLTFMRFDALTFHKRQNAEFAV